MQHTVQALQSELDNLRADNIKLYEKIKFLQSYPGRVSACPEEPDRAEGCLTSPMPLISAQKKLLQTPWMLMPAAWCSGGQTGGAAARAGSKGLNHDLLQ